MIKNLCLNSDFECRPGDGQRVAHDDEDVPAVHKLHAVRPRHNLVVVGVEECVELLHERNPDLIKHIN